jgi:hypothetical protein
MFLKIGRKEITSFFYIYMLLTFISLCMDSGVVPPGSEPYPYFAAIQAGLTSALCVCLLINGFVGFQLYEDGTTLSVWLLRGVSLVFFIITFLVSLATFKSWAPLRPTRTVGLFVMLYLVSGICLLIYIIMQFILVLNTLQDRWPLGDLALATGFLIIGQVILYALSNTICNRVQHYLDGLFFATICNLLAVMMVYKVFPPPPFPLPPHSPLTSAVLGLHHPRRPRVLRRHQSQQLGSQGSPPRRRRPPQHRLSGHRVLHQPALLARCCAAAELGLWGVQLLDVSVLFSENGCTGLIACWLGWVQRDGWVVDRKWVFCTCIAWDQWR